MAVQCDGGGKDELKTQFMTREGVYKLMTLSEYSRPNRVGFNAQGNTPVKVSFVTVPDPSGNGDRICFNVGRELYVYVYKGVKKVRLYVTCNISKANMKINIIIFPCISVWRSIDSFLRLKCLHVDVLFSVYYA